MADSKVAKKPESEEEKRKNEDAAQIESEEEDDSDADDVLAADSFEEQDEAKKPAEKTVVAAPEVIKVALPKPVEEELKANVVPAIWRDGLSDKLNIDLADAMALPPGHPLRNQFTKQLVNKFDQPTSYPEKLAAARALLEMNKSSDGKLPDQVGERDVLVLEKRRYVSGGTGRGAQPGKFVIDKPQHHELQPLKTSEIQDFLERSAPEIEKRTTELLKTPLDSEDRKSYVKHLINIFQTHDKESYSKEAAGKALLALMSKPDGSLPDLVGSRDVYHPRTTKQVGGGRGGMQTVTDKEAYTETIKTSSSDVKAYLDTRAAGILRKTQEMLKKPEGNEERKKFVHQAVNIFRDARNQEDRSAAAIALIELNRNPDGSVRDVLGSRMVPVPEVKKYHPAVPGRGGKAAYYETITPATEKTDSVKLDEAFSLLRSTADNALTNTGRLNAIDALLRSGKITESERNEAYEKALTDIGTPEHVKKHVNNILGKDANQTEVKNADDGRIEAVEKPETTTKASPETCVKLRETFDRILPVISATTAGDSKLGPLLPDHIQSMKDELRRNEVGPATRRVYNHCAEFLNGATTDIAALLTAQNMALPPGCPITVPKDISGRAQSDELFKADLAAGKVRLDIKHLEPDQSPTMELADKLRATGEWATQGTRALASNRLHWEVKVLDANIDKFNTKDDKFKLWKSKEGMSDAELETLQSARAEWFQQAMEVSNYAHTIVKYNHATLESKKSNSLLIPTSITGTADAVFPDEALKEGVFPGSITYKDGRVESIQLDLPLSLDRSDPENLQRMEKIRLWKEKYCGKVDQATLEISKSATNANRMIFWGDIPAEGKLDGKEYNQLSLRFSADYVKAKDADGKIQNMIRVVSSSQHEYVPFYSYQGFLGEDKIGKQESTGKVTINGQPLELTEKSTSAGKNGQIKIEVPGVENEHAFFKTDANGQVFIKDNSKSGIFVNGKRLPPDWHKIDFVSDKVIFGSMPETAIKQETDGKLTINGQIIEKSLEGVSLGKNGAIKFDSPYAEDKHALIRYDQGKVFIKDTSKSGTYVDGMRVSAEQWTEIDPQKQKITLGKAAELEIDSNVRLYKPDDWVSIMLDGKMQILQAKDLNQWAFEAKAWHYGGKAATVAMDVGMVVTGTIELKAAHLAVKAAAKEVTVKTLASVTSQRMLPAILAAEGGKRGAFHLALGLTGFTHQAMENSGAGGKAFNKARGLVMMGDITWSTMLKPAGVGKLFGLGKVTEGVKEGANVSKYLESANKFTKAASDASHKAFVASNFYFIPEIISHQWPHFRNNIGGRDSQADLLEGMQLRGAKASDAKRADETVERATEFSSIELKKKVNDAVEEASKIAALKDEDPAKEAHRTALTSKFFDAENDDEKIVAAAALLKMAQRSSGSYPDVLGIRRINSDALPEEVKLNEAKAFLRSKQSLSINAFDKQAQNRVVELQKEVSLLLDKPADDPKRVQTTQKLLDSFINGKDNNDKLAAALALVTLQQKDGALPEKLGTVADGKGGRRELRKDELEAFFNGLNKNFATEQLSRYEKLMEKREGSQTLDLIKSSLKLAPEPDTPPLLPPIVVFNPEGGYYQYPAPEPIIGPRRTAMEGWAKQLSTSKSAEERAEAAMGLLLLSRDEQNGTIAHKASRNLTSHEVVRQLKADLPSLPPGMRFAAADLLYRMGESSLHGSSPAADFGGILLSVLKDKNATIEMKKTAIINANGIGLADILEKHRFTDEPFARTLNSTNRIRAMADLAGRDSTAIENALKDVLADSRDLSKMSEKERAEFKDLKALAACAMIANTETNPEARSKTLTKMHIDYERAQSEPGSFAKMYFENAKLHLLKTNTDEKDRPLQFQSALLFKMSGLGLEYGVSKENVRDAFVNCVRPNEPMLANAAIDYALKEELTQKQKDDLAQKITNLLRARSVQADSLADEVRKEWIRRVPEFAEKTNKDLILNTQTDEVGDKLQGARDLFGKMLLPNSDESKNSTSQCRAEAIKVLGLIGSNDNATRAQLKKNLGLDGSPADQSPLARNAAFATLTKFQPPGLREICKDLLAKETDPEILRQIKGIEVAERRLDPSSAEYQERLRIAMRDLLSSRNNELSLVGSKDYIKQNFPLLDGVTLRKQENLEHRQKYYEDFGGFLNWSFSAQSTIDAHERTKIKETGEKMHQQFNDLIAKAKEEDGEQARKALTWIVMSNAIGFSMPEKEAAVKRAAEGLLEVANSGNDKAKKGIAPLLTMALTTQDRMPFSARTKILDAVEALKPGTEGSPISKADAGVAMLAALKRQFHMTPAVENGQLFKDSHELQKRLLSSFEKYARVEGIPVLEAIAEGTKRSNIERDAEEKVRKVKYPDKSERQVEYDNDGKIWKDTFKSSDGTTTTIVREGKSDVWFTTDDKQKARPWRGQPYFDHATGTYVRKDAYGQETISTASGARAERKNGVTTSVTRPDGTATEILYYGKEAQTVIQTDAKGIKTKFDKDSSNRWFSDTDPRRERPFQGTYSFDSQTLDFIQKDASGEKTRITGADSGYLELHNGIASFSKPGRDDSSAHVMPAIRDQAQQLLSKLRDSTDTLRQNSKGDVNASPEQLAQTLKTVLLDKGATSEDVVKAVFAAGNARPLTQQDPRAQVLQSLLNDPHEKIQLAAARVLFGSPVKEDRERAAEVICDLQKNATRMGYRKDAQNFVDEVKANKNNPGDAALVAEIESQTRTNAQPRQEIATHRIGADRPIEHQEAYEQAKAALIRNSQKPLDKFKSTEWWNAHGFNLLDERNIPGEKKKAIDSAAPTFFESIWKSRADIDKKYDLAILGVNDKYNEQFKKLLDDADKKDQSGVDAREALSYIVLTQGEPFHPNERKNIMTAAAIKLGNIYSENGEGAAAVEQTINSALVANPNLPRLVREIFAGATNMRFVNEQTGRVPKGNLTQSQVSAVLAGTLESEILAMPQAGQEGNAESIAFQKNLIRRLESLNDRISLPVIEAISKEHPDPTTKQQAQKHFEKMRDSIVWAANGVIPDTTSTPEQKAETLGKILSDRSIDDEYTVKELFRLCSPGTLAKGAALSEDPRTEMLLKAMQSPNERVKFAAAAVLTLHQPNVTSLKVVADQAEFTSRPGLKGEAKSLLTSGLINSNNNTVIGIADAILERKAQNINSKELLALLADKNNTPNLPYAYKFDGGKEIVVRRLQAGGIVLEEFQNGKLKNHVVPEGKNYAQVLLEDSGNYKNSAALKFAAAKEALTNESYGKLTEQEKSLAARNLGHVVSETSTDEKTKFECAKFLGQETSITGAEAVAARIKAFDAIVSLACHGTETKEEATKLVKMTPTAERAAMRSIEKSLGESVSTRNIPAAKLTEEKLLLLKTLFKQDDSEKEESLYRCLDSAEKLAGADSPVFKEAAKLLDRIDENNKLIPLTAQDTKRIEALKLALNSSDINFAASAALALNSIQLTPEAAAKELKASLQAPLLRYTEKLFREAGEIEAKGDSKVTAQAWGNVEKFLERTGKNDDSFNANLATMKRMAANLGATHKDLAPIYEKLAKHLEKGENPGQAIEFRKMAALCDGSKGSENDQALAAKPPVPSVSGQTPAELQARALKLAEQSKAAIEAGDSKQIDDSEKELLTLKDSLSVAAGANSPQVAEILATLGNLQIAAGKKQAGEIALKEAAQIFDQAGTEKLPPASVDALLGLTKLYATNGNVESYKEYQAKLLNLSKMRGFKTVEVKTEEAFTELADHIALNALNKDVMNEAESLLKAAQSLTEKRTGADSVDAALASRKLADFYMTPGPNANTMQAEVLLKKAVASLEKQGNTGEEIAVTKARFANCRAMQGDYQGCITAYSQAMDALLDSKAPVDPAKFASIQVAYAQKLQHIGRAKEAELLMTNPMAHRQQKQVQLQTKWPGGNSGPAGNSGFGGPPGDFP